MKIVVRLIVAVSFIAMFSGCAATGTDFHNGAVASPAHESGSTVTRSALDVFPTSKRHAKGKPWTHMRANGFTGSMDDACTLMGLTDIECSTYKYKHSNGLCRFMDVPNGPVLDALTYTRGSKNYVQKDVRVALDRDTPDRKTEVCDLGGGVFAMRFLGCGNHGLVRGFLPPAAQMSVVPETAGTSQCIPIEGKHDWDVVFPNVLDFAAWKACNPDAECSWECERWLADRDRSGEYQITAAIRQVTGQHKSDTFALKRAKYRPAHLTGTTVFCEQGTNLYWHMNPDGSVQKGIGDH